MEADRILNALAAEGSGVVLRSRAFEAGLTIYQLRGRVRRGVLRRLTAEVYLHTATEPGPRQRLLVAAHTTGGVVSHRTAGRIHGLVDWAPALPEVTVVGRNPRSESAIVHRLRVLDEQDICESGDLPVTTPLRTFIDLGTKVPMAVLERAYERGIDRELFSFDAVVRRRFELSRRGRDGVGAVRELLSMIDPDLAATESDLETILWQVLRDGNVPLPRRQVEVLGGRYRLDMAYLRPKIYLEGDGFGVHRRRQQFERDRWRQNELTLDGWLPLRFTWRMIVKQPSAVVATVRSALNRPRTA